jgi:hypothetical protein
VTIDQTTVDVATGYVVGRGIWWLAGIGWSVLMTIIGVAFFVLIAIGYSVKEIIKPTPPLTPPMRMRSGTVFATDGPMNPTIKGPK